ncbi:uncharacterized protein LOC130995437 isoform X2 [Salvia miltiorrhiza]|uniref:uncharacterized protein LOC130995437 isoform X2 n=1 Tax=Salvia miltiorrhiza TaxID=226208 RepID=UPI0025AC4987|nr:uncharacterized protein LOC130995437 isoform X2 [Salvia miltiorrhiza]
MAALRLAPPPSMGVSPICLLHFPSTAVNGCLADLIITVKVLKSEGSWERPNRRLHVQLLLGKCAMIDAWGIDGDVLQIEMPSESELSDLVLAGEKQLKSRIENATRIPDLEVSGQKGTELSYAPIEMKSGDWILKVVPWVGGRILSMEHLPSGCRRQEAATPLSLKPRRVSDGKRVTDTQRVAGIRGSWQIVVGDK